MPTHAGPQFPETASWLRRIVALVIDWTASTAAAIAFLGLDRYADDRSSSWIVLGIYLLESALGTTLAGGSFGQLLSRIRVLRTDGRRLDLLRSLARSAMICVVIPPLIFRPDGRGLHDLATDSAAYRLVPRG